MVDPFQRVLSLHAVRCLANEWVALTGVAIELILERRGARRCLATHAPAAPAGCGCAGTDRWDSDAGIPLRVQCADGRRSHYLVHLPGAQGRLWTGPFSSGNTPATPGEPCLSPEVERLFAHFLGVIAAEIDAYVRGAAQPPADAAADLSLLVGESAAMQVLRDEIRVAAPSGYTVLVEGESGTGKELVAWLLHALSPRAPGPWIVVNCAALPEALFESEVFGHGRGAFTGAHGEKAGLIEAADGGTLFLDEVGELSHGVQAKLLRFLETGTFYRLGTVQLRRVDARVVAATNRPLGTLVATGKFRDDLYWRLRGLRILVPPLRERRADIEPLARHFLARPARPGGGPGKELAPEALRALEAYSWPGNVRQLSHELESASLKAQGPRIEPSHLSPEVRGAAAARFGVRKGQILERWERDEIEAGLTRTGWNVSALARDLGVSRRTLTKKIARLGLQRP